MGFQRVNVILVERVDIRGAFTGQKTSIERIEAVFYMGWKIIIGGDSHPISGEGIPQSYPTYFIFVFVCHDRSPSVRETLRIGGKTYQLTILVGQVTIVDQYVTYRNSGGFDGIQVIQDFCFINIEMVMFPGTPSQIVQSLKIVLFRALLQGRYVPVGYQGFVSLPEYLINVAGTLNQCYRYFVFEPVGSQCRYI